MVLTYSSNSWWLVIFNFIARIVIAEGHGAAERDENIDPNSVHHDLKIDGNQAILDDELNIQQMVAVQRRTRRPKNKNPSK